jgi:hypothetical protein
MSNYCRWVHTEPWNLKAQFHLVLSLLQKARSLNFPLNICRTLKRVAATALFLVSSSDQDMSFPGNMRLLLMVSVSECALHLGDKTEAIQMAKAALNLQVSLDDSAFALLHLARCYATLMDYKSAQVELTKVQKALTTENVEGWLALVELEKYCNVSASSMSSELCKKAISGRPLPEQPKYMGQLHLACADGFIRASDLSSALKAEAEASSASPDVPLFHLLHGRPSSDVAFAFLVIAQISRSVYI